jgi:hypothetical protein
MALGEPQQTLFEVPSRLVIAAPFGVRYGFANQWRLLERVRARRLDDRLRDNGSEREHSDTAGQRGRPQRRTHVE